MQKDIGDLRGPSEDFNMWHDYLGLRATVDRLARAADAPQLRGLEENTWCPDATSGSSGSGARSAGTQGHVRISEKTVCGFCRQNGESAEIYESHRLKARNGRVLCPVLRSYVCPTCGATGDSAHTRHYCPARALAHSRPEMNGTRTKLLI